MPTHARNKKIFLLKKRTVFFCSSNGAGEDCEMVSISYPISRFLFLSIKPVIQLIVFSDMKAE